MKSLLTFLSLLIEDVGQRCGTCTTKDSETVFSRVETEGLSFVTITLPNFSQGFEKSLEEGKVLPEYFPGWKFGTGLYSGIPSFLRGFLEQVFDSETGVLLDEVSLSPFDLGSQVSAVWGVRQICLSFQKLLLECTPKG